MLPRRRFICPDTGWEIPDSDDLRCTQVRWRQRPERPCHGRVASDANFRPAYGYLLAMPRAHALATKGYLTPCTCFRSHQRGLKKGLDKSCEQLFSKGNWSCSVCFGPVLVSARRGRSRNGRRLPSCTARPSIQLEQSVLQNYALPASEQRSTRCFVRLK
jgi:hypothetical protein